MLLVPLEVEALLLRVLEQVDDFALPLIDLGDFGPQFVDLV